MRRLRRTRWIGTLVSLVLSSAITAFGAYYRFSPTEPYNVDNVESACDTVYVKWWYDGDSSHTHVVTTPVAGSAGLYRFDSTVAEAGLYQVSMQFVDAADASRITVLLEYEAKDTLKSDTSGVAQSVYAEFTDGANEDAFKADVSGLSTFDPDNDSVKVDASTAGAANGLIALTEDAVYANRNDYKADVSGLATQAAVTAVRDSMDEAAQVTQPGAVWDLTTDGHTSVGSFGAMLESCSTTVAVVSAEVINVDGWDPADGVGLRGDTLLQLKQGVDAIEATTDKLMFDDQDSLVTSGEGIGLTGMSTFDPLSDPVIVGEMRAGVIDDTTSTNRAVERASDAVWGDTTTEHTQDGTYGNLVREDSCCGGGGGGDTWNEAQRDSLLDAIADANKENFKADVSGLSTFDPTVDKVTLVDSSADGIHDAEAYALAGIDSSGVLNQKLHHLGLRDSSLSAAQSLGLAEHAQVDSVKDTLESLAGRASTLTAADNVGINADDVTGDFDHLAFEADFYADIENGTRDVVHDSSYTARVDSILALLGDAVGYSRDLVFYWGACDECYQRMYPEGGFANKDSVICIDPSRGADSLVAKIIYNHGTQEDVVDTAITYIDEPW